MGEFNVMIADKAYRRKGYGTSAVLLTMLWADRYMKLKEFFVKINKDNVPSIRMFEKIGFKFYHFNHHFNENEYRIKLDNSLMKKWIVELGMPIRMCSVSYKHPTYIISKGLLHLPQREDFLLLLSLQPLSSR